MAQKSFSISQTPPYTIPAELYDEAYRLYQRKYLLWKNWILEGILTLLTVDFIVTAVKDPSNGLTYFLMVLCVVLLALLIFHPLRILRGVGGFPRPPGCVVGCRLVVVCPPPSCLRGVFPPFGAAGAAGGRPVVGRRCAPLGRPPARWVVAPLLPNQKKKQSIILMVDILIIVCYNQKRLEDFSPGG